MKKLLKNNLLRFFILLAIFLLASTFSQASDNKITILQKELAHEIRAICDSVDGLVGVAIKDLSTGYTFYLNENEVFPTASSIKMAILLEVLKQAEEGKLKLDEFIDLRPEVKVGGGPILAFLGNPSLRISIKDLCVLMVVLSDNTATNILIDRVGLEAVNNRLTSLGLTQTKLRRKMMDIKAAEEGRENISTPFEMTYLLEKIWKGNVLLPAFRQEYFNILALPKNSPLQQSVPERILVADKPGELEAVRCDIGLVFLKKHPYLIGVMTTFLSAETDGNEVIKRIGKITFTHFDRLERSSEYGRIISEK